MVCAAFLARIRPVSTSAKPGLHEDDEEAGDQHPDEVDRVDAVRRGLRDGVDRDGELLRRRLLGVGLGVARHRVRGGRGLERAGLVGRRVAGGSRCGCRSRRGWERCGCRSRSGHGHRGGGRRGRGGRRGGVIGAGRGGSSADEGNAEREQGEAAARRPAPHRTEHRAELHHGEEHRGGRHAIPGGNERRAGDQGDQRLKSNKCISVQCPHARHSNGAIVSYLFRTREFAVKANQDHGKSAG